MIRNSRFVIYGGEHHTFLKCSEPLIEELRDLNFTTGNFKYPLSMIDLRVILSWLETFPYLHIFLWPRVLLYKFGLCVPRSNLRSLHGWDVYSSYCFLRCSIRYWYRLRHEALGEYSEVQSPHSSPITKHYRNMRVEIILESHLFCALFDMLSIVCKPLGITLKRIPLPLSFSISFSPLLFLVIYYCILVPIILQQQILHHWIQYVLKW